MLAQQQGPMASPHGAVSTSNAPSIRLWEVSTGQEIAELKGQTERANAVAFAADGRTLLTGGKDSIIRACDLGSPEAYARFTGHLRPVLGIVALPERRFASCGAGGDDGGGVGFVAAVMKRPWSRGMPRARK